MLYSISTSASRVVIVDVIVAVVVVFFLLLMLLLKLTRNKLPSIEDRRQTDHATTPTRAWTRGHRPRHAARLAALARSR